VGQLPPGFVAISYGADFVLSFFELHAGRMSSTWPGLFPTQLFGARPIAAREPVSRCLTSCLCYFLQLAARLDFFRTFAHNRA
jgi:hypothetical protein